MGTAARVSDWSGLVRVPAGRPSLVKRGRRAGDAGPSRHGKLRWGTDTQSGQINFTARRNNVIGGCST